MSAKVAPSILLSHVGALEAKHVPFFVSNVAKYCEENKNMPYMAIVKVLTPIEGLHESIGMKILELTKQAV